MLREHSQQKNTMQIPKLDAARRLASQHFEVEPDLRRVFLVESSREDDPKEPVKLLEVVEGTIESGIEPVTFPSNPGLGVLYSSVIIELSSREFEKLESGTLSFPRDWHWQPGPELTQGANS